MILACFETAAGVMFLMQSDINMNSTIFVIDFVIFCLQFLYYREYMREQRGESPTMFCFLMNSRFKEVKLLNFSMMENKWKGVLRLV